MMGCGPPRDWPRACAAAGRRGTGGGFGRIVSFSSVGTNVAFVDCAFLCVYIALGCACDVRLFLVETFCFGPVAFPPSLSCSFLELASGNAANE